MNDLIAQDQYKVSSKLILNDQTRKVLTMLYQPIMGHCALSIYYTLWSELEREKMISIPSNHHRLLSMLDMNISVFEKERNKLEALGLLKVYCRSNDSKTDYIYELFAPLSPSKYFKNQVLSIMLYKLLGEVEYEKTKYYFINIDIIKDDYANITKSFNDVFRIDLSNTNRVIANDNTFKEEVNNEPNLVYDIESLVNYLKQYQVKKSLLVPEVMEQIVQLASLYQVDSIEMGKIIIQCIDRNKINIEQLALKCQNYYDLENQGEVSLVHNVQPIRSRTAVGADKKSLKIKNLEEVSPYELLYHYQGSQPVTRDLKIIESIMLKQKLNPGVVNVLIELSLALNDQQLVKPYMETIAANWARKKIKTVSQAMDEALKIRDMRNNSKQVVTTKEVEEVDIDAVMDDIRKLYEE